MEWRRKGSNRQWRGFASHVLGGAVISALWMAKAGACLDFYAAVQSVAVATVAGILWEVAGWQVRRWPGSTLDVLGWPLGALLICVATLGYCGF